MTAGHRTEYEQRVNKVIDHVRAHLADDLSVARLAAIAAFSPFHFHRLFRAVTGETLFAFIQRLRLERAAGALVRDREASVLAIALDHGFASAATFARAFRAHFGMSATQWRAGGARRWQRRKPGKQVRKAGKAARRTARQSRPMSIRVLDLPGFHVAYMRNVGPYGAHGIPDLWMRLQRWITTHDLGPGPRVKLGIALDDPSITAPERCRYDACVVVPPDFVADRWVNLADIPGGRYAVAGFVGTAHDIEGAWDRLYAGWLPSSGYQPEDRPCLEIYRGDPGVAGTPGAFRCELCVPVRPL